MSKRQYAAISEARLSSERNRIVYAALSASAATSVVLALLVVLVQREAVGWARCIAWLAVVILVQSMRLLTLRAYRQSLTEADIRSAFHEKRFILGAAAAGGAWGLASVLLYAPDPTHQVFLAFVVAGVSAGAVSTLGACPRAATWFLSLALTPLVVRLLTTGGLMPLTMAGMTALFLVFLIMSSRRISATLDENSMLRFYEEETQAQLNAAMGMKQAVMDAANYAIVATDTAGVIHTFNQGSARMLGTTPRTWSTAGRSHRSTMRRSWRRMRGTSVVMNGRVSTRPSRPRRARERRNGSGPGSAVTVRACPCWCRSARCVTRMTG